MTYITLYRKYRPKTFAEIVGQDHVRQTLVNALKANKTVHAYLFAGPRGTGKTSTAKILAKALNCHSNNQQPTTNNQVEPCNKCLSCTAIDNGSSVDVLEIDAASNRGIDEIRNLRERVHFAPSQGSKKVFIIDEVHMLTTEAFNALLKMIEEPPEHAVFILATTEVHKVIPTIVSRCQHFDFRRILAKDIAARLAEIAKKEKITADESALAVIARQAQGSVRDSIGLLDQLAAFTDKNITSDSLAQILNLTESELLFEITDLIVNKDILGCLTFIDNLMDKGFDLRQFTAELIQHFRSITIALATKEPADIIHTTPENLGRIQSQAEQLQVFEAIKVIDLLSDIYRQMRFSSDTRLLLEIALIKLTRLESDLSLEGLLYRVEELEKAVSTQHSVVSQKKPETNLLDTGNNSGAEKPKLDNEKKTDSRQPKATSQMQSMENDKIHRIWPVVIQQIKKESIPLYSLLLECHPAQIKDSKLTLVFNKSAAFHLKEATKNSTLITKVLKNVVGTDLEVEYVLDETTTATTEKTSETDNLSTEHVIELMRESFGAEIVEKTKYVDNEED